MTFNIKLILIFILCSFFGINHSQELLIENPDFYEILKDKNVDRIYQSQELKKNRYIVTALAESPKRQIIYIIDKNASDGFSINPLDIGYMKVQTMLFARYLQVKDQIYKIDIKSYKKTSEYELKLTPIVNNTLSKESLSIFKGKFDMSMIDLIIKNAGNSFFLALFQNNFTQTDNKISRLEILEFSSDEMKLIGQNKLDFSSHIQISNIKIYHKDEMNILCYQQQISSNRVLTFNILKGNTLESFNYIDESGFREYSVENIGTKNYLIGISSNSQNLDFDLISLDFSKRDYEWLDKKSVDISNFLNNAQFLNNDTRYGYFTLGEKFNTDGAFFMTLYCQFYRGGGSSLNGGSEGLSDGIKDWIICKIENDKFIWIKDIYRGTRFSVNSTIQSITKQDNMLIVKDRDRKEYYDENGNYIPFVEKEKMLSNLIPCEYIINISDGEFKRKGL